VGSKLPERFKDSDANFNVGFAMGALSQLRDPGCYVCMNARCWRAGLVQRDVDTGLWKAK